ncbi:MAG TPA: DUF1175 family protein, partial [Pyrinomonadaceae bacterium]|nr:DUF1175 family protein [Pyrinomonadaceae bacterium]
RAPLKRWLALAAVVIVSTTALAWSFTRRHHTETIEGTSTPRKRASMGRESNSPSNNRAELIDSDNDGIPDFIELRSFQDRDSFRLWFTTIAETQFYQLSDQWNAEQRDCAGLARFAMREALRHHDRIWFQKMGPAYQTVAPDVKSFDLDSNPFGEKIFRTDFGSFIENDINNGRFSEFADARTLKNFNVVFISRDRREAEPGDLLFYYQPWVQKFPFHVMVFLGPARIAPNGAKDWVVYHTGSSPIDKGTVKKVELSVLDQHPDPRWRPVERNKNFLGFYRLKILQ